MRYDGSVQAGSRLTLVPLDADAVAAIVERRRADATRAIGAVLPDDWPDAHDERFLRLRLDQMRRDPESAQWLVRALVHQPDGVVVGHGGFHGPPGVNGPGKSGAVEIGYTIFPPYRGRGFATEAAGALIEWARGQGVRDFIASVTPGNAPSLAVVRKLGFVETGEQWDEEDGLELVFERSLPALGEPS